MPSPAAIIRLLFLVQLVSMGAMEMSNPFWPVRLRELAPNDAVFGVTAVGVYIAPMLGIALTSAMWGRMGDRYGHRAMMLRALAGLAVTQLGLALAADPWSILALRFAQGAFAGFTAPAQAYGVAIVPVDRRGRLFAFLQVSTNVGSLVGAVGGGFILDHASFLWINTAASGLCVACALAVLALLPPALPHRAVGEPVITPSATPALSLWRNPVILGLLVAHGVLLATRLMPQMPFSLYVSSTFRVENWIVGLCYGLLAGGFIASAALWARAFEGVGRNQALGRIALVSLACGAVALVAGITSSVVVFALSYFVWGALLGATTPVLTNLISREAAERNQGHALGLVQSVTQGASVAGIAFGGLIDQTLGQSVVFPAVAGMYLLACLLVWRARQPEPAAAGRDLERHLT